MQSLPKDSLTESVTKGKHICYSYDSHGRVRNKAIVLLQLPNQSDISQDRHRRLMYKTKESVDNHYKHKRIALHLQYNANNEVSNSITREYHREKINQTCTRYDYDAFGRRIAKHSEIRQLVTEQDILNKSQFKQNSKTQYKHTHMLWDGDKLIQEVSDTHVYTTIYDQGSFAPIARAVWLKEGVKLAANDEPDNSYDDSKPKQSDIQVFYYHNDQLGTPNELTNEDGEVVWLADYYAWGGNTLSCGRRHRRCNIYGWY